MTTAHEIHISYTDFGVHSLRECLLHLERFTRSTIYPGPAPLIPKNTSGIIRDGRQTRNVNSISCIRVCSCIRDVAVHRPGNPWGYYRAGLVADSNGQRPKYLHRDNCAFHPLEGLARGG